MCQRSSQKGLIDARLMSNRWIVRAHAFAMSRPRTAWLEGLSLFQACCELASSRSSHQASKITLHASHTVLQALLLSLKFLDFFLFSLQVLPCQWNRSLATFILGSLMFFIVACPTDGAILSLQFPCLLGHTSFVVCNVCFQLLVASPKLADLVGCAFDRAALCQLSSQPDNDWQFLLDICKLLGAME